MWQTPQPKGTWGGKGCLAYGGSPSPREVRAWTWGRNWSRGWGGKGLTDLLPRVQALFSYYMQTRVAVPTVGWVPLHQLAIMKMPAPKPVQRREFPTQGSLFPGVSGWSLPQQAPFVSSHPWCLWNSVASVLTEMQAIFKDTSWLWVLNLLFYFFSGYSSVICKAYSRWIVVPGPSDGALMSQLRLFQSDTHLEYKWYQGGF